MCDTTTLITAKQTDLHSCWIIYTKSEGKERLTVSTEPKPMIPEDIDHRNINSPAFQTEANKNPDDDLNKVEENDDNDDDDGDEADQSLLEMLDPELQPEPPIPNNQKSKEIYEEHRRLAKEYLQVDTKLYYARDLRDKCLASLEPVEREKKQEILEKMAEKEELLELYNNLKQQLERLRGTTTITSMATASPGSNNLPSCSANESPTNRNHRPVVAAASSSSDSNPEVVAEDGWVVISPSQQNS